MPVFKRYAQSGISLLSQAWSTPSSPGAGLFMQALTDAINEKKARWGLYGPNLDNEVKGRLLENITREAAGETLQAYTNTRYHFGKTSVFTSSYPNRQAQLANAELRTQYSSVSHGLSYFDWLLYCGLDEQDTWGGETAGPEKKDDVNTFMPITCDDYVRSKMQNLPLRYNTNDSYKDPGKHYCAGGCGDGASEACADLVADFKNIKKKERDERLREALADLLSASGDKSSSSEETVDSVLDTAGQGGVEPNNKFYWVVGPNGTWVKCYCDGRRNDMPTPSEEPVYPPKFNTKSDEERKKEKDARKKYEQILREEELLKKKEDQCTNADICCCSCYFTLVTLFRSLSCSGGGPSGGCGPIHCIDDIVCTAESMGHYCLVSSAPLNMESTPRSACSGGWLCVYMVQIVRHNSCPCTKPECQVKPSWGTEGLPFGISDNTKGNRGREAMYSGVAEGYCGPGGAGHGVQYTRADL